MSSRVGRLSRAVLTALAAIAVGLFFYQSIRNHNYVGGNDLSSYLNSARWFFSGENPYTAEVRRFIYPQFLLLVCYPLSFLQNGYIQKAIAAGIWSLLAWFAFFWTIITSWNYLDRPRPWREWFKADFFPLALIILLLNPFLQDEFLNGQVNLVMIGALAGYFFALQKDRQLLAALLLSVAAAIKIGPGIGLLFVFISGQYRTVGYFILLVALWTVGLPYLVNSDSLSYYRYFVDTIVPHVAASDFEHGFKQYSILSTLSYAFALHWPPLLKIGTIGLVAMSLATPVIVLGRRLYATGSPQLRLLLFAALLPVIPLTFPMSEAHHLLILTLPLVVIVDHWRRHTGQFSDLWSNRGSLVFILAWLLLHLGHAVKTIPFRLAGLLVLYCGLLALVKSCQGDQKRSPDRKVI